MIGIFDLTSVLNPLVEHAVLVTNSVSNDRQFKIRTAVQKTGCQATQAAVAQPCIDLVICQLFQFHAMMMNGFGGRLIQVEIMDRVAQ